MKGKYGYSNEKREKEKSLQVNQYLSDREGVLSLNRVEFCI